MKKHYVLALMALLIGMAAQVASPVSAVMEQKLIDFIVQGDMDGFVQTLWYVALIVVVSTLLYYLRARIESKFRTVFTEDLQNDLYDGIMRKSRADFDEMDTAEYISIVDNDVNTISNNFSSPIWTLASAGFSSLVTLVIMVLYSPLLAVIAVGCSMLSFFVPTLITKPLKKRLVEKAANEAALAVQLKEALNGHEVIAALDVFAQIRVRFVAATQTLKNSFYKLALLLATLNNSSAMIGKVVKFITLLVAGGMAMKGQITIGTLIMFISLYSYFSSGIMVFSQCVPLLKSCKPIIEKLTAIIDYKDDTFTGNAEPSFSDKIDVNNLCFQYKEGHPVLKNLNLTIHKNEKLALVGASGCGKSTLIKLLSGTYANYQGAITYDDVELKQLDNRKLRKMVTVIHQKTYMFNDTIRYNICLGQQFSKSDFDNALRLSGVEKFLPLITDGVDGQCGEDGANLSGG